jgi:hypothetical protein
MAVTWVWCVMSSPCRQHSVYVPSLSVYVPCRLASSQSERSGWMGGAGQTPLSEATLDQKQRSYS